MPSPWRRCLAQCSLSALGPRPTIRQAGRGRGLCTRQPRAPVPRLRSPRLGKVLGSGGGRRSALRGRPELSRPCITHRPLIALSRSCCCCLALAVTGDASAAPTPPGLGAAGPPLPAPRPAPANSVTSPCAARPAPDTAGRVRSRRCLRGLGEGWGRLLCGVSPDYTEGAWRLAEEAAPTRSGGSGMQTKARDLGGKDTLGFPTKVAVRAPQLLVCLSRKRRLSVEPERC